jgi:hypothetical protein
MSEPLPFTHRLRVRYCETDRMGVAHHGSYVAWFEEARTEWLRVRGKTYRDMEDEGSLLQVVALQVEYRQSVTYDDAIEVAVRVTDRGPACTPPPRVSPMPALCGKTPASPSWPCPMRCRRFCSWRKHRKKS